MPPWSPLVPVLRALPKPSGTIGAPGAPWCLPRAHVQLPAGPPQFVAINPGCWILPHPIWQCHGLTPLPHRSHHHELVLLRGRQTHRPFDQHRDCLDFCECLWVSPALRRIERGSDGSSIRCPLSRRCPGPLLSYLTCSMSAIVTETRIWICDGAALITRTSMPYHDDTKAWPGHARYRLATHGCLLQYTGIQGNFLMWIFPTGDPCRAFGTVMGAILYAHSVSPLRVASVRCNHIDASLLH